MGAADRPAQSFNMQDEQAWSSEQVAASMRTAWWRELMSRQFNGLHTDFYGDRTCDATLVTQRASDVTLARLRATRHRVFMRHRTAACDAPGHLKIIVPYEGEAWVEQHDRVAQAKPGKWIIYDMANEYTVSNPGSVDHLVVVLPRELLQGTELVLDELVARPIGSHGFGAVAWQTMFSIHAELPYMPPHSRIAAGETVAQLVRLALLESFGRQSKPSRNLAMQERIRGYVLRNLNDPALSLDSIARALRCSKRLLHECFQGSDQTIGAYIQAQRIEACARDLRDPALRNLSITEIALARGFVNTSHFSKSFKDRMDVSPRAWRMAA